MAGVGGVGLDLGAQPADVDVDQAAVTEVAVAPDPLEEHLAAAIGKERAAEVVALDTVWWFSACRGSASERAVFAALACAIAEPCDGIVCESDDERVFATPNAFMTWWNAA